MLDKLNFNTILFLDIETVPEFSDYSSLSEKKQKLWEEKTAYKRRNNAKDEDEISAEDFYSHAGIWAEFGKIICISVGFINGEHKHREFRIKSFFGHDEKKILEDYADLLNQHFNKPNHLLCGHNIKEFDNPYIARRFLVNQMALPKILNLFGKKPWEVPHLDTMDLWKFGDYKHFTSLKLLTEILGIESPKGDIDGSQVRQVYYEEKDLDRIVKYCERDVVAVAQVLLRFAGKNLLETGEIIHLD